jgi:hypothetical protein
VTLLAIVARLVLVGVAAAVHALLRLRLRRRRQCHAGNQRSQGEESIPVHSLLSPKINPAKVSLDVSRSGGPCSLEIALAALLLNIVACHDCLKEARLKNEADRRRADGA